MSINNSSSKNSLGLDLSTHNLNNSSSKQKFSFPKASRFDSLKLQYIRTHLDAIRFIKYPARDLDALLPSAMATRTSVFALIAMHHNQQPIILTVSSIVAEEGLLLDPVVTKWRSEDH